VVSDYEYRQRVRRYKPSSLVPLIAAAAARYWQQHDWLNSPCRVRAHDTLDTLFSGDA
jgi:hypothetical protein